VLLPDLGERPETDAKAIDPRRTALWSLRKLKRVLEEAESCLKRALSQGGSDAMPLADDIAVVMRRLFQEPVPRLLAPEAAVIAKRTNRVWETWVVGYRNAFLVVLQTGLKALRAGASQQELTGIVRESKYGFDDDFVKMAVAKLEEFRSKKHENIRCGSIADELSQGIVNVLLEDQGGPIPGQRRSVREIRLAHNRRKNQRQE